MNKKSDLLYKNKFNAARKQAKSVSNMIAFTEMGVLCIELMVLFLGIVFSQIGWIKFGTMIAVWNVAIGSVVYPISELPYVLAGLIGQMVSLDRIEKAICEQKESGIDSVEKVGLDNPRLKVMKVRYRVNENFSVYADDFECKIGQIVYVVGPSGSGKSTFAKLLMSLYKPDEGEIVIEDNTKFEYDDKTESMREDVVAVYGNGYHLKGVSFSYDSKKESVINDLNAEINENFVAIVGESGSGKTTLLKLLSGLYDPLAGCVILKIGENVWSGREISEHVCYVSQNNQVFTDSILENIRYGNVSASDDEVVEAAKLANVDEFVRTLPQGYNTIIGENSDIQLSTGQLQRIALARGMIRHAEVYLLDEVTSALDALNQQTVISNLQLLNKK